MRDAGLNNHAAAFCQQRAQRLAGEDCSTRAQRARTGREWRVRLDVDELEARSLGLLLLPARVRRPAEQNVAGPRRERGDVTVGGREAQPGEDHGVQMAQGRSAVQMPSRAAIARCGDLRRVRRVGYLVDKRVFA